MKIGQQNQYLAILHNFQENIVLQVWSKPFLIL